MPEAQISDRPTLVITGNPVDGFFYYGPFDNAGAAIEWAERNQDGQDWWIAPLANPQQYEAENEETPEDSEN